MRKIEKTFPRTKRCLCESCREDKGTRTHSGRFNSVLLKCTVCRTLDTLVFATIEPIEQEVARIFFSGGESEIHFSNLKFFFSFSRSQPTNLQFWRLAPRPPHSSNALAILLPPTDALRWIGGSRPRETEKQHLGLARPFAHWFFRPTTPGRNSRDSRRRIFRGGSREGGKKERIVLRPRLSSGWSRGSGN